MGAERGGEQGRHLPLPWVFGKKSQNWKKVEVYQRLKPKIKSAFKKLFFWREYSRTNSLREGGGGGGSLRGSVHATIFQIMSYEELGAMTVSGELLWQGRINQDPVFNFSSFIVK
jgi:hypothetical protein